MWVQLGQLGKVDICPELGPDTQALVCAKLEWGRDDLRRFYGNGLEEGQDVVGIVCNGGPRLGGGSLGGSRIGGGLLCFTWIRLRV